MLYLKKTRYTASPHKEKICGFNEIYTVLFFDVFFVEFCGLDYNLSRAIFRKLHNLYIRC